MQGLDVAIYLRKSRADVEEEQKAIATGETYDTLGKHRRELLHVARQNKHNVMDIYEELVSGEYIASRPAMQQMLENIAADKYEAILVVDIDRLGRGNKADQSRIENALKNTNTLIITPSQIFDLTQEDGEFGVEVRTFLANMEYRSIKRRLQRGLLNSAAQGKDIGGPPPYGFSKTKDLRLHVKEPEAQVIRDIFRLCVDGVGVRGITRYLHDHGILSPTGNEYWGPTMIKRVISNPKYMGTMVFGRRQHTKLEDGRYTIKKKRDDNKYVEVPDAHEAIIPRDMWEQAQRAMKTRAPRINTDKKLVYSLAGLVRCARCGRLLRCMFPKNRKYGYLYCGKELCDVKGIRLDHVENAVIDEIGAILERVEVSDNLGHAEQLASEKKAISSHLAQLESDKSKDDDRKAKIYESYEEGVYTKEMFLERLHAVQKRQRERSDLIERLRLQLDTLDQKMKEKREIIPMLTNVLELYEQADVENKNRLLKTVIQSIVYDREPSNKRILDDFDLTIYLVE